MRPRMSESNFLLPWIGVLELTRQEIKATNEQANARPISTGTSGAIRSQASHWSHIPSRFPRLQAHARLRSAKSVAIDHVKERIRCFGVPRV